MHWWSLKVITWRTHQSIILEAFLKEEDLGLEDLERIVGRETAAVHTHPRQLHQKEPCVGLKKIPDVQIRDTNKDPSSP